ncbi:MAG: trimeric intracellular cation channel family protein [Acidiferrobacterales bacterium]|jgi:uncharacterized membrane protein YeiH|nr:trimeric intracellular cation channel family protein [Acidiferrobacterales bacterium]
MTTTTLILTQAAVAVSAASGVLEAGKKRFDLFGMLLIAFAAALGGGSIRDVLLDRPVFWVNNQDFLFIALGAGLVTFFLARWTRVSRQAFLLPDAAGLVMFTIVGTNVSLSLSAPWFVASFMGVITGVMGGVLRDILCNEEPIVFQGTLYATIAWVGALVFIALLHFGVEANLAAILTGIGMFASRLAAIRWNINLPVFRFKS